MDELHRLSAILIERETIDKDQFERLLAGEDEATVFPDEPKPEEPEAPAEERRKRAAAEAGPAPVPGRDHAARRPRAATST